MTVIAWDGETLAADRQSLRGDTIMTTRKLWPLKNGGVVAISGLLSHGIALKKWVENGVNDRVLRARLVSNGYKPVIR